jgi:hypothetical protein
MDTPKTFTELHLTDDGGFTHIFLISEYLKRIAVAQEQLLAIALEARKERNSLADQMKKAFQQPLEKPRD